jgi:hypothetical protein
VIRTAVEKLPVLVHIAALEGVLKDRQHIDSHFRYQLDRQWLKVSAGPENFECTRDFVGGGLSSVRNPRFPVTAGISYISVVACLELPLRSRRLISSLLRSRITFSFSRWPMMMDGPL